MIELGDKAKDTITGLQGIVVCESRWLHGCRRLTVQPQALHDGKAVDGHTFDEGQLELIEKRAVRSGTGETGGPSGEPQRHPTPTR